MDLAFSAQEESFKQEVIDFFEREEIELVKAATAEWEKGVGYGPLCWVLLKKLGERGWLCPTWPREYGGLERSYMYKYIVMDELLSHTGIYTIATGMSGPIILHRGNDEQRREYLPRIARGEIETALGYTEPDAGSDLASLAMKAEDKGDHFLVTGQKVFNTRAHYAQYHWLAARTDPTVAKHKGISLFIVDLKTPGITVRPIWTVSGFRTNEVFYDSVKVPRSALVGEKNRGFYYVLEALDYERVYTTGRLKRDLDTLVEYAKQTGKGKDPVMRQKLAESAIDIEVVELFAMRVASMLNRETVPNYEAAMLKTYIAEAEQRMVNMAVQMFGPFGTLKSGSKWAPLGGRFEWRYRESLETVITRGTPEIMRNIMAQKGLGLPRG